MQRRKDEAAGRQPMDIDRAPSPLSGKSPGPYSMRTGYTAPMVPATRPPPQPGPYAIPVAEANNAAPRPPMQYAYQPYLQPMPPPAGMMPQQPPQPYMPYPPAMYAARPIAPHGTGMGYTMPQPGGQPSYTQVSERGISIVCLFIA